MKQSFGWSGQILRVDLPTRRIRIEPTEPYGMQVLGGRGIGQSILFHELDPNTDPLGPDSKVILSAGPLVGTLVPGSGRLSVDWKNVQTGGVGSANLGGHFAPELKYAGFDSIVIEGKADKPVVLFIQDGKAQLFDASSIWGKNTWETEDALRKQLREPKLRVACIGPAGENLVKGACLIADRSRAAGRGGVGAVLGAKKLKAIAVRGRQPIYVHNPKGFLEQVEKCFSKIKASEWMNYYCIGGTQTLAVDSGVRNHQDDSWPHDRFAKIGWEIYRDKFEVRRVACFNCPVYCGHFHRVKEGSYAGTEGEGVEANTIRGLGTNLDIDSPEAILKGQILCNQLGLDVDFAAATLGWAFESYQRGLLSTRDTGGLELTWGNADAALRLITQICYRQALGALLAEGVKRASDTVGGGSEQWALHIKGADLNEGRMRSDKAWALGIGVATRGGGHLEGAPFVGVILPQLTPEKSLALFGVTDIGDITAYDNKARVVFWQEKVKAIIDCMGICSFFSQGEDLDLNNPDDLAILFSTATGVDMPAGELLRIGQRIHNIEKAFNTLHANFSRKDDFPPIRYMTEPIRSGPYATQVLSENEWNRMLDEYYTLEGWDPATGQQTEAGLLALGLSGVAEKLKQHGRL